MEDSSKRVASGSKLSLAIGLIGLGLILILGKGDTAFDALSNSFQSEPVDVQGFSLRDTNSIISPDKIIIPSVGIDLEVEKAEIVGGYWQVFPDKAGWGAGSGVPGEPGNQVIFAHARKGLFEPLRSVKVGQKIYVSAGLEDDDDNPKKLFEYVIKEIREVAPDSLEVISPTKDETLTLYTCTGFRDAKRLIVIAKKI